MSEMNRAWAASKVGRFHGDTELRKQLKDAFKSGWEYRGITENKRVAKLSAKIQDIRDLCSTGYETKEEFSRGVSAILDKDGGI
jgi:hypothetical protein